MFLDWLLKTQEAAIGYEDLKMLAQNRSSWRQWRWKPRGVYPPNGNDANFRLLPLSRPSPSPCPFPSLPPLPGSLGQSPSGGGPGFTPGKNWNWNRIWCILAHFCFKTAAKHKQTDPCKKDQWLKWGGGAQPLLPFEPPPLQ